MKIPYVIDNEQYILRDVLNDLLAAHRDHCLDVATAYFTVQGYKLIKAGLDGLGNFRLLLGAEPRTGEQIGVMPNAKASLFAMRGDLEREPFNGETLALVEELIRYLRDERVAVRFHEKGFLHAKCYLFYSDRPGQQYIFERFRPVSAIVGSSNLTGPGLTSNRELNVSHKVILDDDEANDPEAQQAVRWLSEDKPSEGIKELNRKLIKSEVGARAIIELEKWFEKRWEASRDFKDELIELLDASKFGEKEYTPHQVYMKALFEYFKDELGDEIEQAGKKSVIELADFQKDAVKKARKILRIYDGVIVADPVGIGKTWIGKKLLEEYACHMRQKALIICPASLKKMWENELREATIPATILTQELLGRDDFEAEDYGDADFILIDESHNFRNRNSNRYGNLERLISMNGSRGRDGLKKQLVLLTATPINNDLLDLYNQICLFTGGDKSYFAGAGIGDLYRYFLKARRESRDGESAVELFNLLEEVVVRRSRAFIKQAYPETMISGKKIKFPERALKTEEYNLEATYQGIYDGVVSGIESLKLAPYNLESYKKDANKIDKMEEGRGQALVGIFKSRYLKRFESSVEAFRISVTRALEFQKTFEAYILDGKLLKSWDFHKAMQYLAKEDEEDDAAPTSRADDMDGAEDARLIVEKMERIDTKEYNLRKIHEDVQRDIAALSDIWEKVKGIGPDEDKKLGKLKELLSGKLKGKKTLVFSYYKDTARYLFREIGGERGAEFRESLGGPNIKRIDGGINPPDRERTIQRFSPKSNKRESIAGTADEIDILFSTDVLSEGQNLQDCGHLINYDLHWNPVRMVQRAGRVDRIGSEFDRIYLHNMFPDEGLEKLLKLVESLTTKINMIDQAGFLDASILGETVHPKCFNTLRRIKQEDGSVIEEEEQFTELVSSEYMMKQLAGLLEAGGKEKLDELPDGIHSGLARQNAKGMFFYFTANKDSVKSHFWKYYDLKTDRIIDNRYLIGNLIACSPDTPRVIGDCDAFEIQQRIIDDILRRHEQQRGLESAPKTIDPLQQTIATTLQGYLNNPNVDRKQTLEAIKYLNQPMLSVHVKELRALYNEFQKSGNFDAFIEPILDMTNKYGKQAAAHPGKRKEKELTAEDLRLVCFDYIVG